MILQVDAGNSRVHWRYVDPHRAVLERGHRSWEAVDRDGLEGAIPRQFSHLEFASVAGERAKNLKAALAGAGHVKVTDFTTDPQACGVRNAYPEPGQMGVDRWLAILGAYTRWGGPLTVVDAGTAVTIDHVDSVGNHHGGYILPGAHLMKASLGFGTSGVRPGPVDDDSTAPGITTSECVQHGIAWAMQALAHQSTVYWNNHGKIILTGGDAPAMAVALGPEAVLEPELVFCGMDAVMAEAGYGY
ncbi:type III pantothenate kinase [Halomonadaceae bacterium KBTZ08]